MTSIPALTQNQMMLLRPQAINLFNHLRNVGSVSSREAMLDLDMTSATLASRVCDLETAGVKVFRQKRVHPASGRRYTRYVLQGNDTKAIYPAHVAA